MCGLQQSFSASGHFHRMRLAEIESEPIRRIICSHRLRQFHHVRWPKNDCATGEGVSRRAFVVLLGEENALEHYAA